MGWKRIGVVGLVGGALAGLCGRAGFAAGEKGAAGPAAAGITPAAASASAGEEFFEAHVRPVLAESCYGCHGPDRQMAGLRLDSKAALLKGSATGPVVVPGEPEKSALIRAIRYAGSIKMPPTGKLPQPAIEALTTWVKIGAPWPAASTTPSASASNTGYTITDAQRQHWAFQPVRKPPLPVVKDRAWAKSPIDLFVLARLEPKGLKPNPPADKLTLIRRATFDLTGLPPTIAEIDAFLADHSPNAFARVVDRLLASPRYGERWGRHWLDVARYADTKGYTFQEDSHYQYAYSYRDYVIRALNEDLPYNQFILQQLAADQLPLGSNKRPLAAMGYLTLGRRFLNNQPDIIDDRIDVVSRGLMGLTVSCARCHNHKFDPIPTNDYYSLYGVFASSTEPAPVVITPPAESAPFFAHQQRLQAVQKQIAQMTDAQQDRLRQQFLERTADYLVAAVQASGARRQALDKSSEAEGAGGDLNPLVLERWRKSLKKEEHSPIFGPLRRVASAPAAAPPAGSGGSATISASAAGTVPPVLAGSLTVPLDASKLNPLVARRVAGKPPASVRELAQRYAMLFGEVDRTWRDLMAKYRIAAALAAQNGQRAPEMPTFLPDPAAEAVRQVLYANDSPLSPKEEALEPYFEAGARDAIKSLREQATQLEQTMPRSPDYAMTLEDAKEPYNPHVFLRGNPGHQGDAVPRQLPLVLAGVHRQPFEHGSGRLELAQAIASKTNPLTARVMVNRIWLHHFGEGLVRTPSDFGMRSDPPAEPELLDYLAARFVECGWSIKAMHRLIMLSSTYQMTSDDTPRGEKIDPENRLLWRMNRRRLELEPLRDALLAVSGQLDPTMGGPAVGITTPPFSNRRTVYGFIDRQNLQGLFRTFDFASPDTTNAQRHQTTVPQQALFMMNSPFVIDQARQVAARRDVAALTDPARRIRYLYRLLFGRLPTAREVSLGLQYLKAAGEGPPAPDQRVAGAGQAQPVVLASSKPSGASAPPPASTSAAPSAWEQYIQVLLMTNEFAFVD